MIKLISGGTPRTDMGEGRSSGLGSMLCKKTGEDEYTLLGGITACKDFVHDILISEKLDKNVNIYGFKYSKQNAFSGESAHLAIAMLKYGGDDTPTGPIANFERIPEFLNYFEDKLSIGPLSKIELTDRENVYLLTVPIQWVSATFMISLLTLLVRVAYYWAKCNLSVDDYVKDRMVKDFIEGEEGSDVGILKQAYPKYEAFIAKGIPEENFQLKADINGTSTGWHHHGILGLSLDDQWLIWKK